MPPVSSVLEKCVVGKEVGNESQPVGGLYKRRRRAGVEKYACIFKYYLFLRMINSAIIIDIPSILAKKIVDKE